jgi:hypothetical protein
MPSKKLALTDKRIHGLIREIRDQKIILDSDLARVYGVSTSRFNEAVKRNRERFPSDFMFRLTVEEYLALTSQIAISKPGRGGRRTRPYAFTEHGALMAANVLKSSRAIKMSRACPERSRMGHPRLRQKSRGTRREQRHREAARADR